MWHRSFTSPSLWLDGLEGAVADREDVVLDHGVLNGLIRIATAVVTAATKPPSGMADGAAFAAAISLSDSTVVHSGVETG